jgi:hypothetical protein
MAAARRSRKPAEAMRSAWPQVHAKDERSRLTLRTRSISMPSEENWLRAEMRAATPTKAPYSRLPRARPMRTK